MKNAFLGFWFSQKQNIGIDIKNINGNILKGGSEIDAKDPIKIKRA